MTTIPNRRLQIRLANLAADMEALADAFAAKPRPGSLGESIEGAYAAKLMADAETARKWEAHLGDAP